MKLFVALCLVAVVAAAPPPQRYYPNEQTQILEYENENIGLGNYRFRFVQSDGTRHEAQGQIVNEGREDEANVVSGIFSWVRPDGIVMIVKYVADQNGYQPDVEEAPPGTSPGVVASLLG